MRQGTLVPFIDIATDCALCDKQKAEAHLDKDRASSPCKHPQFCLHCLNLEVVTT